MKKLLLIISLFCAIYSNAQTRLYSDRLTTSAYSPTLNAAWTVPTSNTYISLLFGKSYGRTNGVAAITSAVTGGAAIREITIQTMITPMLAAQTIASGSTISAQFRTSMSSTSSRTGAGKVYVRLMNENGTIASEIGNATTTNLTTTVTNRTYSLTLGSNVTVTGGQRIVFEFGWRYLTGSDVNTTGAISSSMGAAVSDLPVDNTTTTASVPWIEFSQTLIIASGYSKAIML